jgi:hypothetical protein
MPGNRASGLSVLGWSVNFATELPSSICSHRPWLGQSEFQTDGEHRLWPGRGKARVAENVTGAMLAILVASEAGAFCFLLTT